MATFKSIDRDQLAAAFAIAHRMASRFDTPDFERRAFRAIARELWNGCRESGEPPAKLPQVAEDLADAALTCEEIRLAKKVFPNA